MVLLRERIGDGLRRRRLQQGRTLRQVSQDAKVSLGYLSEVERGQKEASSELLASICEALDLRLSELLASVAPDVAHQEHSEKAVVATTPAVPVGAVPVGAVPSAVVQASVTKSTVTKATVAKGRVPRLPEADGPRPPKARVTVLA